MKYLFAGVLVLLSLASLGVRLSQPDLASDVPVIYWVTDKNPARELQVQRFHEWLVAEGHVGEDGRPIVELRLDVGNSDNTKKTIQSISGVGGDLMDTNGPAMHFLEAMGVLVDLTDDADAHGYGIDQTFPGIAPDLLVDGRQFRYPANVATTMLWVNPDLLRRYGLEPPPLRWTWEQFEALGVAFRDAANPPGTRAPDRKFISADIPPTLLSMTNGVATLNETLTASTLDDPRYVDTLETYKRWRDELNIIPRPDDVAAAAAEQGYGGPTLQLFGREQYAMFPGGRYHLIQLRRFGNLSTLDVVEPPYGELPATTFATRAVVLYRGSKHPELAKLFLRFLASESYNQTIVEDADAMPPNPAFTHSEAFLRPPLYPREWGVHERFVETAQTIAVPESFSPYVLPTVVSRERNDKLQAFLSGRLTAEEAARSSQESINRRIEDELRRKPELRAAYAQDLETQRKIDDLKARGQPIPAPWIKNPYHRYYYAYHGLLLNDAPPTADDAARTPASEDAL